MKKVHAAQLGIADCDFAAEGNAGEIVNQFVDHLRAEHGIDMPDAKRILEDKVDQDDVVAGRIDRAAWIVTQRLQEKLGISQSGTEKPWPPTG